jgi:hypothetical protein
MAEKIVPMLLFAFEESEIHQNDSERTESDSFVENIITVTIAM